MPSSEDSQPEKESLVVVNPPPYIVPPPPRDLLVGPMFHVVVTGFILVLAIISLGTPWYTVEQYQSPLYGGHNMKSTFSLWKTVTTIEGVSTTTLSVSAYCTPIRRRVRAMEIFTCLTIASAGLSFLIGILNVRRQGRHNAVRRGCALMALLTFALGTAACSLNFVVYYWSFPECGKNSSFHSQLYEPSVGFGFILTAWVWNFVVGLTVLRNGTIPVDARTIDEAIFLYMLFSFVGLLFATISSPIPHWVYKNAETQSSVDVTLWKTIDSSFNWHLNSTVPTNATYSSSYSCSAVRNMFFALSAMSVAAAVAHFAAFLCGVLLWMKRVGAVPPAIVCSILGGGMSFVQIILETVLYYNHWCDGAYAYATQKFVLGPGYALVVTAACVMLFASLLIIVAHIGIKTYFPSKLTRVPVIHLKES